MIDPTQVILASEFNAFKYSQVREATVTVSGTLAAGATTEWDTTITLDEAPTYFTVRVKTTSLSGGTPRWQQLPPARYYDVPASGPASSLTVQLAVIVDGNDITFRAWTLNPFGSTITFTSTDIDFVYVPYTLDE